MTSLKECWARLPLEKDKFKKLEIQKEINRIESYCIQKKFAGIKELTDWKTYKPKVYKTYRHEQRRDGGHNIPSNAYIGKDRCGCCIWNRHTWCDRGKTKPCVAKI